VHAHDARDMVIKLLTGGDDVNGALRRAAHGAITLEPPLPINFLIGGGAVAQQKCLAGGMGPARHQAGGCPGVANGSATAANAGTQSSAKALSAG
jgi:hypothetical protein